MRWWTYTSSFIFTIKWKTKLKVNAISVKFSKSPPVCCVAMLEITRSRPLVGARMHRVCESRGSVYYGIDCQIYGCRREFIDALGPVRQRSVKTL